MLIAIVMIISNNHSTHVHARPHFSVSQRIAAGEQNGGRARVVRRALCAWLAVPYARACVRACDLLHSFCTLAPNRIATNFLLLHLPRRESFLLAHDCRSLAFLRDSVFPKPGVCRFHWRYARGSQNSSLHSNSLVLPFQLWNEWPCRIL